MLRCTAAARSFRDADSFRPRILYLHHLHHLASIAAIDARHHLVFSPRSDLPVSLGHMERVQVATWHAADHGVLILKDRVILLAAAKDARTTP